MGYGVLSIDAATAVADALAERSSGIVVATTGSTGAPRMVRVSGQALRASGEAAHARLGGPGRWLLALPEEKIAGANVLARAELAGTTPVRLEAGPFSASAFARAVDALDASDGPDRRYASLVPTQLVRALADPVGVAALARLDAVLVGGAALTAHAVPANVVASYGMTETVGGCVFDGEPLDGVDIAVDSDGRIYVAGPSLADGYADGDNTAFLHMDGRRWFQTPDLGRVMDGRLTVDGRVDDVIVTGGHKVHPSMVEAAIGALAGVAAVAAVGVPDSEWGKRVVALVEPAEGFTLAGDDIRDAIRTNLERHAVPREIHIIDSVPTLAPGKIDRAAVRRIVGS